MRIDLEDCDTPLPSPSDVSEDLDAVPHPMRERCVPYSSNVVAELWTKLVRLSIFLGTILKLHSKKIWQTEAQGLEKYEAELQEHAALVTTGQDSGRYEQFFAGQVRLHYELFCPSPFP